MKKETVSINNRICEREGMNFCPYCGSENVRFVGFIHIPITSLGFMDRKNFFMCRDCKKKLNKVIL